MATKPLWYYARKQRHMLNNSDGKPREATDVKTWVRLYLELAVATRSQNRSTLEKDDLSKLEILQAAIDTSSKSVAPEELNPKYVATVYIRYRDSCEARVGKDVDRVALVTRDFTEGLENFSLVGQTLSSEIIPKNGKKRLWPSLRLKQRLLSSTWHLRAYKYSGAGLSPRLHKARSIEYLVDEQTGCEIIPKKGKKRSGQLWSTPRRLKAYKYSGVGFAMRHDPSNM